jgi:hypothetical protein
MLLLYIRSTPLQLSLYTFSLLVIFRNYEI